MRIHFIAIGGAAMHNLAIALHKKGYTISGSDDEIFEPSKSRLEACDLLPKAFGWFPEKINSDIDVIILGMHARKDNPELLEAQKQNLKIFSYPEYLFEQTKNKKRIVVGGSHGKTTITSMIMHVLRKNNINHDYMVGANIKGFDTMVQLDEKNAVAVIEGDEYLSSPIDLTPKFHWYKPHVAILSGIAWDHINVFPTFENYLLQFEKFVNSIQNEGKLFWFEEDSNLLNISKTNQNITSVSYNKPDYIEEINGKVFVCIDEEKYELNIFGEHNLQNAVAALNACKEVGVDEKTFWLSMSDFEGAAKRLQLVKQSNDSAFYIDFAHAPSKLKATIKALKQKYPKKELVACLELHTFSSLQKNFIPQYKNTMDLADKAIVYYSHDTLKHKQIPDLEEDFVAESFGGNVTVYTNTEKLQQYIASLNPKNKIFLLMSSGNFNGINFQELANQIID